MRIVAAAVFLGATLLAGSHAGAHERGAPDACTVCQWAQSTPAALHAACSLPPPGGIASPVFAVPAAAGRPAPADVACRGPPRWIPAVP
jgi:hypothetical protein